MQPRTSVNNNDNLRVQWDLSGFYPIAFESCNVTLFFFEVICLEYSAATCVKPVCFLHLLCVKVYY